MMRKADRKPVVALVAMAAGALLLAAGLHGYDRAQGDRIAPGIEVAGVEVGGRTVEQARAMIEDEIVAPLQRPLVVGFEGERYRLSATRLERRIDVDRILDEAVERTREGSVIERVARYARGSAVDAEIPMELSYSEREVDRFVAELAERINREPRDASILPSGDRLIPTPERRGIALREGELRARIAAAIGSAGSEAIEAEVEVTEPEITTGELAENYPTFLTVDRDAFKLRLFKNLKLARTHTIAVGAIGYETPAGLYHLQTKEVNPTWQVPDSEWTGGLAGQSIPPGPSNPLKARWMGIYDGAGIHGTDDLASLGTAASHGCIRMAIPEVIELFDRVEVGTPVYIQ